MVIQLRESLGMKLISSLSLQMGSATKLIIGRDFKLSAHQSLFSPSSVGGHWPEAAEGQ